MFTQTGSKELLETGITRRQLVKGSAYCFVALAGGSSIAGLPVPAGASDTRSVTLSSRLTTLIPAVTRCYVLKCKEGYLLIDVPYPGNYDALCECVRDAGIEISEIKYLLLTHHHDDHVGCVDELVRDTGARIIVHERAVSHLAAGRSDPDDRPINRCIGILVGIYGLFHEFVFPPVLLSDKDLIVKGDDDSLLAGIGIDGKVGDAAMNFMEFCRTRHRPIYIQDLEQTFQSWEKLREHGAQVVYPSHGDPFAADELVAAG
jgi:glyoxylase-like metal-dependent hydrolase (beta-lactamase superfamily II)